MTISTFYQHEHVLVFNNQRIRGQKVHRTRIVLYVRRVTKDTCHQIKQNTNTEYRTKYTDYDQISKTNFLRCLMSDRMLFASASVSTPYGAPWETNTSTTAASTSLAILFPSPHIYT